MNGDYFWRNIMVEENDNVEKYCKVTFTCRLDNKPVEKALIILTRISDDSSTSAVEYKLYTDEDGVVKKNILYGKYKLHAEYITNQYYSYDTPTDFILNTTDENIPINMYRCENEVLLDKSCKYFHHDPYMTPNNYDLYFDYTKIPVNNIVESPYDLRKRLQRKMPLTKVLHLNLETQQVPQQNNIQIYSSVKLDYGSFIGENYIFHIYCEWDKLGLEQKIIHNWEEYNASLEEDVVGDWEEYNSELDESEQISLEDYKIENGISLTGEHISLEDYKVEMSVDYDSGKEDFTPLVYELNRENGWEVYTVPVPYFDSVGDIVEYGVEYDRSLPLTVLYVNVSEEVEWRSLELL